MLVIFNISFAHSAMFMSIQSDLACFFISVMQVRKPPGRMHLFAHRLSRQNPVLRGQIAVITQGIKCECVRVILGAPRKP